MYNMKMWLTSPRLIHEKGFLETSNLNINNGIFRRDTFSSLCFCLTAMPLSTKLKNTANGYQTST